MFLLDFDGSGWVKAVGVGVGLSALYVGSLFVVKTNKPRDHPDTMWRRMCAVSAVTAVSPLLLYVFYGKNNSSNAMTLSPTPSSLSSSGIVSLFDAIFLSPNIKHHIVAATKSLLLFAVLFVGPIIQDLSDGVWATQYRYFSSKPLEFWRNFIVGPVTEEVVFRGCITAPLMYYLQSTSGGMESYHDSYLIALIGPLYFGIAHAHHYFEGVPLIHILVQIAYTTLFGFLSAMVMIKTNSLISAIVVHSFCNWMGLPGFLSAPKHKHKYVIVPAYFIGLCLFLFAMFTKLGSDAVSSPLA
eukprot:m.149043 g.149043  ORF g.149043 m.149043 type:complete len:299 (+) comp13270_c0_seq1:48-944(+)